MNRSIYRKVAKRHGVSGKEVKKSMQAAITEAYINPPNDRVTVAYQSQIPCKGKIPTPEECIRYACIKIKKERKRI